MSSLTFAQRTSDAFGYVFMVVLILAVTAPLAIILGIDHLITHKIRKQKSTWDLISKDHRHMGWSESYI